MSQDMTRGNPARLILLFALPLFAGNLFQQLYNMADTLIVGRALGAQALAAVGCTGSLSFLILGFAQGLTSGFSVVLAQRTGARDAEGVRRSYGCAILLTGLATLLITPAAVALCGPLLELLRTPADILPQAQAYISIIFGGMFVSLLFNLLGNTLRALGDSRTPLYFLVAASVVNIVLDILLITRFSMGVQEAALATVAAQLVSGGLCLWYIGRRFPQLKLSPRHFLPGPAEVWAHLRIGLPMAFQTCLISIGTLILQAAAGRPVPARAGRGGPAGPHLPDHGGHRLLLAGGAVYLPVQPAGPWPGRGAHRRGRGGNGHAHGGGAAAHRPVRHGRGLLGRTPCLDGQCHSAGGGAVAGGAHPAEAGANPAADCRPLNRPPRGHIF